MQVGLEDRLLGTVDDSAGATYQASLTTITDEESLVEHVDGPVGVQSRNFGNARIYSIGWQAKVLLKEGISLTYPWIEAQVKAAARSNLLQ